MKIEVELTCGHCGEPLTEVTRPCEKGAPHRHARCMTDACYRLMPPAWALCVHEEKSIARSMN